jgi:Lon protease-like protein
MAVIAMFPLRSVLFPFMPLAVRIFEERYRVMLARVLAEADAEFGVVLIERGREAGGGEKRFDVATVAEIHELGTIDDDIAVVARGGRRVEVVEWLEDDPYPLAVVRDLPDLEWDEAVRPLREQAELVVRRAVARASEFVELPWSSDAEISDDPVESSWQLAGMAPIGQLDQLALLRSTSLRRLLTKLMECTIDSGETIAAAFVDDELDAELAATIDEEAGERPENGDDEQDDEKDDGNDDGNGDDEPDNAESGGP